MLLPIAIAVVTITAALGVAYYFLRPTLLDLLTSRTGYRLERNIAYGPKPRQKLDLYVPAENAETAPLIVFFYGSDWRTGSKKLYRFLGQPLASRGYLVAIPDYPKHPPAVFPEFIEDGALAVAYLWQTMPLPDGAPRRLILMGHSAGAHTAALLTTDRHYLSRAGLPEGAIDRLIAIAGPYDFVIDQPKYQPIFPEATRPATQPIAFVDGKEPPILLMVGIPDVKLDPGNTTRFAQRIKEKGGDVVVKTYPGVSHPDMIVSLAEALPGKNKAIRDDILEFLGHA